MNEPKPTIVIDLTRVALSETAEGLTRTPIAVIGSWVNGGKAFKITAADFAAIYANFNKLGTDGRNRDDVVVDYNHVSVEPDLLAKAGGDAPAAGWLRNIVAPAAGDEFLLGDIEFTDKARSAIAAKEYKYLSPEILFYCPDKRTGKDQGTTVPSLALTNTPFLDELPAITLTDRGFTPAPQALAEPHPPAAASSGPAGSAKEKPAVKKVNVSPIKSGDNKGHLKISHPDLPDGSDFYANKDDVAEALSDSEALDDKAAQKLSEITGLRGKPLSEQLGEVRSRLAVKPILLSEVPLKADGPDKGAPDFARFAPEAGRFVASEIFIAQATEAALDDAVKCKAILPKERPFLRKLALSELREYLASRAGGTALNAGEAGHAGSREANGADAIADHDRVVRAVLGENRKGVKSYGDAMRVVAREKPEVRAAYDAAQKAAGK